MAYDFDKIIDRRNTTSMKWDVGENEIPMWVADMDFEAPFEVKEALAKRVTHGVFGYTCLTEEWYEAYVYWWKTRHAFAMEKEWLLFATGIVPALASAVKSLTKPTDKVLIQSPVYNMFFNAITNNGREIVDNTLVYDGTGYHIDFEDLEKKLADPEVTLMILCNPHNPVGKIWDRETLACIGELCAKNKVLIISDEIHCDLTMPGREYIPFASVSDTCRENSISCIAPTKTFNIAGCQTAAVSVPNEVLRKKVEEGLHRDNVNEPNAFSPDAAIAAFMHGAEWLDELRDYIQSNKEAVLSFVAEHVPQVKVVPSEATYLLWLDFGAMEVSTIELCQFIRRETGLFFTAGAQYGGDGDHFVRMNIACPRATLMDGLDRMKTGLEAWEKTAKK